jgi:hypothetical protein
MNVAKQVHRILGQAASRDSIQQRQRQNSLPSSKPQAMTTHLDLLGELFDAGFQAVSIRIGGSLFCQLQVGPDEVCTVVGPNSCQLEVLAGALLQSEIARQGKRRTATIYGPSQHVVKKGM